jgi:uncharacterized phage protein (TIGR02220 family)
VYNGTSRRGSLDAAEERLRAKGCPPVTKTRQRSRSEEGEAEQLGLFGGSAEKAPTERPAIPSSDEIAQAVLDHLNEVTERTGPARFTSAKSIKERIKDGAGLEDLLLVTDFCHALWWGDRKMETYVRPRTLFGKENFPEYLARGRKWVADGRPSLVGGAAGRGPGGRTIDMYSTHVKGGGS